MTYTTKTLRNEYMKKAQDIGSNAIRLVNDFFSDKVIDIVTPDRVNVSFIGWTLTDLDRAIDEMEKVK